MFCPECQLEPDEVPGFFYSGVPGVLCHVEGKRIVSQVERCDACQRFESDVAALRHMRDLGYIYVWRPSAADTAQALAKPVHAGMALITLGWVTFNLGFLAAMCVYGRAGDYTLLAVAVITLIGIVACGRDILRILRCCAR